MFRILSCVGGHHDIRLVGLAAIVCLVTSFVAINLFRRACVTQNRTRAAWIAISGIVSGCSIWATHFIAMLAYEPGLPVAYDELLTGLSFLVAVAVMALALGIAAVGTTRATALIGGALVGVAIAAMHYIGMLALEVPGRVSWAPDLTITAIALGIIFGMIAMEAARRHDKVATMLIATLALAAAILSLHFIAMSSIVIVPDPTRLVTPSSIDPSVLALCIAMATTFVLAAGTVGSIVDQHMTTQGEQLAAALHNMSQGLCMLNKDFQAVVVNSRFREMFCVPASQISLPMPMAKLMDLAERTVPFEPGNRAAIRDWAKELAGGRKSGKTIFRRTDGRIFSISHEHMPSIDGWVETFEDITERRQAEEKIAYMARHDSLTGLPNRALFREYLEKAVEDARPGNGFAVLCLDLDHFKSVNDTLGHQGGDLMLQIAARRLRESLREGDVVSRFGGDEFAILQIVDKQPTAATALAQRIVDVMGAPISIGDQQICAGISIGISLAPGDAIDPDQLLKNADMALYRAKADGRGTYRFFEPEMDARMQARRTLELELRQAVTTAAFVLYYQPIVDLETNEISSFEALIRWQHPVRGLVSPEEFIPLAEENGLIIPIGEWVLREACAQAATWPEHVKVAVNLSAAQFKNANLASTVVSALAASRLPPTRLELEITESALLMDSEVVLTTLHELRNLGVGISMDDFGTGYSSLGYLRKFPFDKIKIDQSFIRDLANSPDSLAIVRAVTGLGNALGILTVAEGVETAEQLKCLKAEGCTKVQGFLFGAAKPATEALRHLTANRKLRVVA